MSLDWDEDEAPAPRGRAIGWRIALLGAVLFGSAVAVALWRRYDPFVVQRRDLHESQVLIDTAHKRHVTEAEFERVVALLSCGTPAAQMSAVVTLEIIVARDPPRRDRALSALEACRETAPPEVRQTADGAIDRLKAAPKRP